jgi:hypothetical protein
MVAWLFIWSVVPLERSGDVLKLLFQNSPVRKEYVIKEEDKFIYYPLLQPLHTLRAVSSTDVQQTYATRMSRRTTE